jgi:hypothetical protein
MGMIGNSLAQGLISGANIQDGTVDTPDIKDSAVTAAKIASGVITPAKLSTGAPSWDTSGNLGLGVTPSAWATGDTILQVKAGSGTGSFWGRNGTMRTITNGYFDGTNYRYTASSLGVSIYECSSGLHTWANAASGTAGNTFTPTERMRIDSSGSLLLGTSSNGSDTNKLRINGANANTTAAAQLRIDNPNGQTRLSFAAYQTSNTVNFIAGGSLVNPAFVWSNNDGSQEHMRLDTSGNLLVGDTTAGQTSGYGIKIAPAGDGANYPRISLVTAATTNGQSNGFSFYSVGAAAWRFYVGAGGTISATSTTITGISDQRLKENIRDLDDGLEKVMALQPRKFDWKEGKGQDIKNARGFIAQEFEEVFPDMIEEWLDPAPEGEEPYKAVNANLIPTLVKAIQEQQAIIEALTTRITALETP